MSGKDRLKLVIEHIGVSTNKFAALLDYGRSETLYKVLRGEAEISASLAHRIASKYPSIRMDWLLTGEGEMLKGKQYIEQLPVMPMVNEGKTQFSGRIHRNITIPYFDIEISAGTVNFFNDYQELPHSALEIPFVQDVDLAMPVYGDSMYPKIKNGDIVLLKEVHNRTVILFGEIYLVITKDYRTLKYIRKCQGPGKIMLVSENDRYDPVEISVDTILKLFLYKGKFEKSQI